MTSSPHAPSGDWITYNYAILRLVPHVHTGTFVPVGVMLHARTAEFLGIRVLEDAAQLERRAPGADSELLLRYLRACRAVVDGDDGAGPVALAPPSERFHWLTAPRSDMLQSSPVHEGLCHDPRVALDELYERFVAAPVP